jgi:colanic acid/amylovoran biosynthesis protein
LVSALAQGVPSVIHGWSHKYKWLAEDFGASELVQDPFAGGAIASETLDYMFAANSDLRNRIAQSAIARKGDAARMWEVIVDDLSSIGMSKNT